MKRKNHSHSDFVIEPYEPPHRFMVKGKEYSYLVDLSMNNGIGECGCWDFEFRRRELAERGMFCNCKHLEAVRAMLRDE